MEWYGCHITKVAQHLWVPCIRGYAWIPRYYRFKAAGTGTGKENSQDQPSIPNSYTVATGKWIKKALKQADFKSLRNGNDSGSGGEWYVKSDFNCHKCGKKGHIKKYCWSKGNSSSGNLPKKSANEIPVWVTNNTVVSYTKDLATATTSCNNRK